jgi:hypothetical protein
MYNSQAPESYPQKNSKISDARFLFLPPFGEVAGILNELDENTKTAVIGGYIVRLPLEMITSLKPDIGKRLTILRTDENLRPYRWQLLD